MNTYISPEVPYLLGLLLFTIIIFNVTVSNYLNVESCNISMANWLLEVTFSK